MRFALLAALALTSIPAAAQTMEPGEWQFINTTTSPILPKPQTTTLTQCVSQEDAADPTRFTAQGPAADCEVKQVSRTAESYSWTVSCPKQGMRGAGKARFGPGTVESEMQMTLEGQGGEKMELHSVTKARHLGPCKTK